MWEFPVAPGTLLQAATEELLTQQIFEFRIRNNIPIGDIEADIEKYYCAKWPSACVQEPSDLMPGAPHAPRAEPLKDRIARWVTILARSMPKGGYKLVDKDTAEARATACHGCPQNKAWRGGCSGCTQSVATMLLSIRQMRKTTRDGNLLGCEELGNDCQTHVWLEKPSLTSDQLTRLPERCWIKHETANQSR